MLLDGTIMTVCTESFTYLKPASFQFPAFPEWNEKEPGALYHMGNVISRQQSGRVVLPYVLYDTTITLSHY